MAERRVRMLLCKRDITVIKKYFYHFVVCLSMCMSRSVIQDVYRNTRRNHFSAGGQERMKLECSVF